MTFTEELCSAASRELRKRGQMLDQGRGDIVKLTITLRLDAETGAVRGAAVEDERVYRSQRARST